MANWAKKAKEMRTNTNPPASEKKPEIPSLSPNELVILNTHREYDTLHPEEHLREFVTFCRDVVSRYEENERQISLCDKETQDVLHYAELHPDMNAQKGFDIYKKLREIRRRRRQCKNEIDLLDSCYQFFKNQGAGFVNQLSGIQGICRTKKAGIDSRSYVLRTGVIQEDE